MNECEEVPAGLWALCMIKFFMGGGVAVKDALSGLVGN